MLDTHLSLQPTPQSLEEAERFAQIQDRFAPMYRDVFSNPTAPRTVVVVPSMTLDVRELAKISGVVHYEERMLCLLMLLQLPRTQLTYVTSLPVDPAIIDYYLHLLPGIPGRHARKRLKLISVNDPSLTPLSEKILESPETLAELKRSIDYADAAHMTCFNTTHFERTLAVQLGIPMYACDPALTHLGNKSKGRRTFRMLGLSVPDGFEHLYNQGDLRDAILALHRRNPRLRRAVIKLNDGFSGEGNAIISLEHLGDSVDVRKEITRRLHSELQFEAIGESWEPYIEKMAGMGGIVEEMIDNPARTSPSVQMRVTPLGAVQVVSTHDQVLSGPSGQVFEGCTFPARARYRKSLHEAGLAIGNYLKTRGVVGRFGVDFISTPGPSGWEHHAIEINLRKGGTTLPYLMLEFLTDGEYDQETGQFHTPTGDVRTYYATDNLVKEAYKGLTPEELIDMAVVSGLHYHASSQHGLVFHLLGAVTNFGKVGMVSIAPKRKAAKAQYRHAVAQLDKATAKRV